MIIKYISSNRDEFDFYEKNLRVIEGSYHEYAWKKIDNGNFEKEPIKYNLTFQLRGDDQKRQLDRMTNDFEQDIIEGIPGTFVFGEYSINGYVVDSSTHSSDVPGRIEREITIYCPYGFWVKYKKYSFTTEEAKAKSVKRYPNRYPYRYASNKIGETLLNDGVAPAHFKMYIYGPASNPDIRIGDNRYWVKINLDVNERLEIDSQAETIYKVLEDGTKENSFQFRQKGVDFFKGIAPGLSEVTWSGKMMFDIILNIERSEPEWQ